jgi:hypothetical protein
MLNTIRNFLFFLSLFSKISQAQKIQDRICIDYICAIRDFEFLEDIEINCNNTEFLKEIFVFPNARSIFNNEIKIKNCSFSDFSLSNIKEISLNKNLFSNINRSFRLNLFYSDFKFSFEPKRFTQNLFNNSLVEEVFFVENIRYYENTIEIIFKDAFLKQISLNRLSKSNIFKNFVSFKKTNETNDLNSTINNLYLGFIYKIDLSETIHVSIFNKLKKLETYGQIEKIENDNLFVSFKNLKLIIINELSLKHFFHYVGLRWMKYLNNNILYKKNDSSSSNFNKNEQMILKLNEYNFYNDKTSPTQEYVYPDEDFCLFRDFPHKHLVFPYFYKCYNTCLFNWLIQYRDMFQLDSDFKCNPFEINCNFSNLIMLCDTKDFYYTNENQYYIEEDEYQFVNPQYAREYTQYILLVVFIPLLSAVGIFLNSVAITALLKIKKSKDDSLIIYQKMLLYCFVNMVTCVLYSFKFTSKCIDPLRSLCINTIVTHRSLRFFFTVLFNFIGNSLKTYSNFIFFIISVQRYCLITSSKCKFLFQYLKDSKTSVFLFIIAFCINIIKIFEFSSEIDYKFLIYPLINTTSFDLFFYINNFILFSTNFLLFAIQSFIDYNLLKFIIKSNKSNKQLGRAIGDSKEKLEKRMKLMILSNGVLFFLIHLFDILILILKNIKEIYVQNNFLRQILFYVIDDWYDLLFFINTSGNIIIFYFFNLKFRKSIKKVFLYFEKC